MRFRKKPVEIEAVKTSDVLLYAKTDWKSMPSWVSESYEAGNIIFAHDAVLIKTLEGSMRADLGDWIIRGVKGEIYPCKPDIFDITYDVA